MLEQRAFELPTEEVEAPQIPKVPETPQEKKKRLFLVVPTNRPEVPETKENTSEKDNKNFDAYQTLGGCLEQPEYETALHIMAPAKETYMTNARVYADVAGLVDEKKLSYEVLRLYAVLRDYHNTPSVPDKLAAMSDPELLAEVLRMKGESEALDTLKNSRVFKKP